jgi:hypothetical protein
MKRGLRLLGVLAALLALAPVASCWPGWDFIFDQTPSREHRLEDLRVLAVLAEPAALAIPAAFVLDGPEPPPLELEITPFIFDPRGGDVDVALGLCASGLEGIPCAAGDDAPSFSKTVRADAEDPLGRVDVRATLRLDRAQLRALYRQAGVAIDSARNVNLSVVVNVARDFGGKRERESAVLTLDMRLDALDPALPAAVRERALASAGLVDCAELESDGCAPSLGPAEPTCGDGLVEGFEECDPPDGTTCDESCFALDICHAARRPVCFQPLKNSRPLIEGLIALSPQGPIPEGAPTVARGGVIRLRSGTTTFFAPTPNVSQAEPRLEGLTFFCPEGTPGEEPFMACGFERVSWRAYVLDRRAELFDPDAPPGQPFVGNTSGGLFPFGVAFLEGTAPGTREPLVVVVADQRGGMDLAVFTLEAEE